MILTLIIGEELYITAFFKLKMIQYELEHKSKTVVSIFKIDLLNDLIENFYRDTIPYLKIHKFQRYNKLIKEKASDYSEAISNLYDQNSLIIFW